MKILIVNCYPSTPKGNRAFADFYGMCKRAIDKNADGDDIIIDVKKHTALDDYIFLPTGWNEGLEPKVKKAAKQVFDEGDEDGSGTIDGEEMFQLMQILFKKLGITLRQELLPLLKEECQMALELYDDDGSGELDFEEFCMVLSRDPWREMLPTDSRKKENAMRSMKNFCMCDLILVDGDPYILPWSREGTDLFALCHQVWMAQTFDGGMNISLLGSAVTTQMMQYIQMVGPEIVGIFNGNGKGCRLKPHLERVDLTQEAPRVGALFLDNTSGDCYKWDSKKHDPKFPTRGWKVVHNLGLVNHASRNEPPRRYDSSTKALSDSTKTVVKREPHAYQHWIFEGNSSIQFLAPCSRVWDMQQKAGYNELRVLATSMRGVEVIEDSRGRFIGTMFSFQHVFKETENMIQNFVKKKFYDLRVDHDSKGEWYLWMTGNANNGKLAIQFPQPFKPYKPVLGPQLPKRPGSSTKTVKRMGADGNLQDVEVHHDDSMGKAAAAQMAKDEAGAEFAQKAGAWDVKKNAKTMANLLKVNQARCFETDDVATGVSSAAKDVGVEADDSWRMSSGRTTPASRSRSRAASVEASSRPSTAMAVRDARALRARNRVTNRPNTANIQRISSGSTALKKLADIVDLQSPITKYEERALMKEQQLDCARNLTPAPKKPLCRFKGLEAKSGVSGGDSFVPDAYVSDYDRIKQSNKVGKERWMGDAFLTASGTRKPQGIKYGHTPFLQFSYERPVIPDKWMRDSDFIKVGRSFKPFDPPMRVPKR